MNFIQAGKNPREITPTTRCSSPLLKPSWRGGIVLGEQHTFDVAGEGRAQIARSLGVDPSTLRRLLMGLIPSLEENDPSAPVVMAGLDDESHEQ